MKILFVNRAKSANRFSFEELFSTIKKELKNTTYVDFYDKSKSSFFKCIKAIKNIPADIIHLTGGLGYYTLFLPSKKTILTIHDTNHYEHDLKGLKKWMFSYLFYRIPYKNTYCLTTVSEHTKSRLIDLFGFTPSKIKVIPNCYPLNFKPSIKDEISATTKVLQIGTKSNKNILRLLNALQGLDVELTIIGNLSSALTKEINQYQVKTINKCNLTHQEIYQEYKNCDIVAFVSLHEGFGLPIIEANAVGRAVITSSISSMPEIVKNAGHIVDPYNVEDIRNGIKKLISDNNYRNELIQNGFENCENYHPEKIALLYEELYQKIARK